jgi:hypothetical protein
MPVRYLWNADSAMKAGRPKADLVLSEQERSQLQLFARSRSLPAALCSRARIVISSAEGEPNNSIAERLGLTKATAGKWRTRFIDFKNTLILLTTNAGTDMVIGLYRDLDLMPEPEGMAKALREPLLKIFPRALLGRLVAIPYYPLSDLMLGQIVKLQLNRIKKRVEARYRIASTYGKDVVKLVVSRCTESESGGRIIDTILTNTMCLISAVSS